MEFWFAIIKRDRHHRHDWIWRLDLFSAAAALEATVSNLWAQGGFFPLTASAGW